MRFHFQERPLDLYIALSFVLLFTAVSLILGFGNPFGLIFVFIAPGYVFVAALFPGNVDIDWMERIALSLGTSVLIVPLLGLLLNFTPWGIFFMPLLLTITLFTVGMGIVASARRIRLPAEQRLAGGFDLRLPTWREYNSVDKILTLILIASIAISVGTVGYALWTPRPGERFTEFYILGPGGNASGYPVRLNVSQLGTVIVGVVNHETTIVDYAVRIDLVGVKVFLNSSSGGNETVEVNRTTLSWFNTTLFDNQDLTQPFSFSIPSPGLWKTEFLLFKNNDFSAPYRKVHLYTEVA